MCSISIVIKALDSYLFDSLQEVKQITRQWIEKYNCERPHESLGKQSPIDFAEARNFRSPVNYSTFDLS